MNLEIIGVTLSHHMILNNSFQTVLTQEYDKRRTVICLHLPLYHSFGMVLGHLSTITSGVTCVMPSPVFDAEMSLRAIEKEKCTAIFGTPTMFVDMINHPNLDKYDLSSLDSGIMGGSTSPIELMKNSIDKLNMKNMVVRR